MRIICAILLASLVAVVVAPSAEAARIGVASAVANKVTGLTGANSRALSSGDAVFQNDVVRTFKAGSAQLLFLDETSMTVGPNSSVTLDRFVYDPRKKVGQIIFNVTKGAFRFVSGSAKSNSYKIKTPVATIGVRGTIFEGYLDMYGNLILVLIEGAIEVCSPAGCSVVDTPGQYIKVGKDGQITIPATWDGPTLDVRQGINFAFESDNTIRRLGRFSDPLPRTNGLNDALDSRDVDVRFPPATEVPGKGAGGCSASCNDYVVGR